MADDPILRNDWHVVAKSDDLYDGKMMSAELLDDRVLVWRSGGEVHAWRDRCPHRGTRLSLGEIRNGDTVVCPYHGWHFDGTGNCSKQPAHPSEKPSAKAAVTRHLVQERYGLIWVCVGEPAREVPEFHGADADYHLVITGPYDVATSGPRAVENFLDMAHFPFVHKDILGEEPYTEVKDYNVEVSADVVTVTNYRAYQPRANAASSESVDVEYTSRVLRPLTVMLTKEPGAEGEKPADIILMSIQPKTQESIRVWFVLGMNYGEDMPTSYFSEFQDRIFFQDKDILESQRPICLPLDPGAEFHQRADRTSLSYRRWLKDMGLTYGVVT